MKGIETHLRKNAHLLTNVAVALIVAGATFAGKVTLPHFFAARTAARASEVNDNFSAVKTAVDDNDQRIAELTARLAKLEAPLVWQPLQFGSTWTNFESGFQTAEYAKDALGFVHLRGLVKRVGTAKEPMIGLLPDGFRPAKSELFAVVAGGGDVINRVDCSPDGQITASGMVAGEYLQLSGLTFYAR